MTEERGEGERAWANIWLGSWDCRRNRLDGRLESALGGRKNGERGQLGSSRRRNGRLKTYSPSRNLAKPQAM